MAWGQEKGTDVKISALPVSMRFFDFVPCSLPLKTLILLTFSCFLIRRRGISSFYFIAKPEYCISLTWNGENEWASGYLTQHGLSEFGRMEIRKMERQHILVDVSHLNNADFWSFWRLYKSLLLQRIQMQGLSARIKGIWLTP